MGVIGGDAEADATRAFEHVATRNLPAGALDLLVDDGLPLADHAGGRVQHEVALGIHLELVGSMEAEPDPLGIGARTDDEIVFELALVAVVDQVDPRVDVLVSHLRVRRDIGPPVRGIAADEVVGLAWKLLCPHHGWLGVGTDEDHPQDGPANPSVCERQDGFARCEKKRGATAACEESDLLVCLPLVSLKVQGEPAVGRVDPHVARGIRFRRRDRRRYRAARRRDKQRQDQTCYANPKCFVLVHGFLPTAMEGASNGCASRDRERAVANYLTLLRPTRLESVIRLWGQCTSVVHVHQIGAN